MQEGKKAVVELGYWNGAWRGQIQRLILEYTELEYSEKRYPYENPEYWFKDQREKVGLDFPNLPYIIDLETGMTVSETVPIGAFIAEKGGKPELNGKGLDRYVVEQLCGFSCDVIFQVKSIFVNRDREEAIFQKGLAPRLDRLLKYYGTKEFALGYLTVADFFVYGATKQAYATTTQLFEKEYKAKFQPLWDRIEALPAIANYMKTSKYISYFPCEPSDPQGRQKYLDFLKTL